MTRPRASGLIQLILLLAASWLSVGAAAQPSQVPTPLAGQNDPHAWVFAFKLNGNSFPTDAATSCLFGGVPQHKKESLQYAVAQSDFTALVAGSGLLGTSLSDPVGATFNEIYNSGLNFVVWNDQLYDHPAIAGCSSSCGGPWGHSKGIIAWDNVGNGIVLQVSTPSWPGSGTSAAPRTGSGNTLGCIAVPNNVLYSQHFFGLKLTPADTAAVLDALANSSVVTDVSNPQLARLGGPTQLQAKAQLLGRRSDSSTVTDVTLSTGVRLISKPSALHVPPWQMVSARLGGVGLRTATWWASPRIPTTQQGRQIACWRNDLGTPGRVEIALDGTWQGKSISLIGGGNHAKLGVSIDGARPYVIFGDLNQQGQLTSNCGSSQNGRGGLFYVLENSQLHANMILLLSGGTAPTRIASSRKRTH